MAVNQENVAQMQQIKYDLFKEQNPEIGRYDVIFDVEGKLLYAHKTMLNLVSDTFDSMLSDRWAKKDEPIKIKDYSYDNFYQLLTFLYAGHCHLNGSNIYAMVDLAEFYGVALFKKYCDAYLSTMVITVQNIFQMMELFDKYSLVGLKASAQEFILHNFQSIVACNEFMKASKSIVGELVFVANDEFEPEDVFKAVLKWSKKQAKGKLASDPSLNLNDAIKAEIADFLPHINFYQMKTKFLVEYLVPRGFIFSSLGILSNILSSHLPPPMVKVTNELGQTLHGEVIQNNAILRKIESLKSSVSFPLFNTFCYWNIKCKFPGTRSPFKKRDGIEWYLIRSNVGEIGVMRLSLIERSTYILAELIAGTSGFDTARGCKIEIE